MEKFVTFTPTTIGWYRIVSGGAQSGGTIRLTGSFDNRSTDVEFQYYMMGFGQQGSIQQTRFGNYNSGFVDQVRISNDGAGNCYLDIHIASATSPAPVNVWAYGPNQVSLVASPTVGAAAAANNVATLTLGNGFNTTAGITTGGWLGIGITNPAYLLDVIGAGGIRVSGTNSNGFMETLVNTSGTTTSDGLQIWAGSNSSAGAVMIYFVRPDGTAIGSITQNSATTVAYNTSSDRRIKENILDTASGLDLLAQVRVRDYNYIADPEKQTQQGFIAQELYSVYPQAVTVGGEDPKTQPWQVDYGKLTPLLVKSVQDLRQVCDAKDAEIAALKDRTLRAEKAAAQIKAKADKVEREAAQTKARLDLLMKVLCEKDQSAIFCH